MQRGRRIRWGVLSPLLSAVHARTHCARMFANVCDPHGTRCASVESSSTTSSLEEQIRAINEGLTETAQTSCPQTANAAALRPQPSNEPARTTIEPVRSSSEPAGMAQQPARITNEVTPSRWFHKSTHNQVYLSGADETVSEEDIVHFFGGHAHSIAGIFHKGTYAFVHMVDLESAQAAIDDLDGETMSGRRMRLQFSRDTIRWYSLPAPAVPTNVHCFNCGGKGHKRDECPSAPRGHDWDPGPYHWGRDDVREYRSVPPHTPQRERFHPYLRHGLY